MFLGLSWRKSVCYVVLIFTLLGTPGIASAGVFSYVSDVLFGSEVLADEETFIESSSQNMPLLEAALAVSPSTHIASDITIVGDEALLPEVGPSTVAPEYFDTANGQISTYIVRSGDTFAGIAEMFDITVNTLLWANDLNKNSVLKAGQSLVILPMSGVLHKVVSGDTLISISKKYSGDIDEIALFNDIKTDTKLSVGQMIMIPDGEMSFSTRPSTAASGQTSRLVASASGPEYVGYYQKPFLTGRRTQGLHGYNGVDYGMPIGTPLYAAASGVVIISKSSGYNGGYGLYVVIQHSNNSQTVYAHMSSVSVFAGQKVSQGQLIGYSGNTGKSTGPHLHFEVRGAKNPF